MADSIELLNDLDEVIKRKQQEIRERKQKEAEAKKLEEERTGKSVVRDEEEKCAGTSDVCDKNKHSKPTRAAVNRANGAKSQGPITPEGKQRASANSLKHGFFAAVEKLNPQDAPIYQRLVHDLRHTLHPDNPVEEMHIRELAMLSARLQRLEAAEYALLCSELEAPAPTPTKEPSKNRDQTPNPNETIDSRQFAVAFLNTQDTLDHLQKIEVHLRRAYKSTWERLRIMQKERRRLTPEESRKRTHQWLSDEHERTSVSPSPNPLDNSRDFDDDFPPNLPDPSPSVPPNHPSPTSSDPDPTPKEPPSA